MLSLDRRGNLAYQGSHSEFLRPEAGHGRRAFSLETRRLFNNGKGFSSLSEALRNLIVPKGA